MRHLIHEINVVNHRVALIGCGHRKLETRRETEVGSFCLTTLDVFPSALFRKRSCEDDGCCKKQTSRPKHFAVSNYRKLTHVYLNSSLFC